MEPAPNAADFINAAAAMFNDLAPIFVIVAGIGLGIGLMRHLHRAVMDAAYGPVSSAEFLFRKPKETDLALQEKPKNSDLLWPEKPKNDQVSIGDDGELVYGDPHQEGEPGGDPFFHKNN